MLTVFLLWGVTEMFSAPTVGMVVQLYEYTNSHWIKGNKRLSLKGYELYFTGKYLATRKLVAVHGRLSLKPHLWLKISV